MPNNGDAGQELISFIAGNNVYCKTPNNENFKMYSLPGFQGYNYLSYFDTTGDLMSYNVRIGDKNQQVDRKTQEVLEAIGWKEPENGLKIVADGIDNTGIASALQGYRFHAEIGSGSIMNYSWQYELLNDEMDYVLIKEGKSSEFTIDKVDDLIKYKRNVNGDIKGKISLNATVDGKEMSKVFHVYLTTKPTFISVKIDAITLKPEYGLYDLDLTVIYTGADYLHVMREEEWSIAVETRYVYEPYVAHLHFKSIDMDGRAWVNLELNNEMGKSTYMVEIPSQTDPSNPSSIEEKVISSNIARVEVRNIQGKIVLQTDNYETVGCLPKGIYIVTTTYADKKMVTKKICR